MKQTVEHVEAALGCRLPQTLIAFWREHNGSGLSGDHFEIYSLDEVVERNQTFESARYSPGCIAIGNDTGSRVAMMAGRADADEVWINDASSMRPNTQFSIGCSLHEWVERDCPFALEEQDAAKYSAILEVNLVLVSSADLKALFKVRSVLGSMASVSQMKQLPAHSVLASVSYIKAISIVEELGMPGVLEIRDPQSGELLPHHVESWRTG